MPVENPRGRQLMWLEKRIYVRWLIEEKRYHEAYKILALITALASGARFAEAEFTAGWLALTKLKNPLAAKKTF